MELTLFLSKVTALYLVIGSVGILINAKRLAGWVKTVKADVHTYIAGAFALIIGLLMVLSHNVWVADWPVVVTIMGWAALIKGILLMWYPDAVLKMSKTVKNAAVLRISGTAMLIIGALLWMSTRV